MNLFRALQNRFGHASRRETLTQLRNLPERQLLDCGISPALLSEGVRSWPWMEEPDDYVTDTPLSSAPVKAPAATISNVVNTPVVPEEDHPKAA